MKRIFFRLLPLLLCLCLLCGCDGVFDVLSGGEEQDAPAVENPQEEPEKGMASESVLDEVQTLDALRLAWQPEYGLNPYETASFCNRTVLSVLYEPLYTVNSQFAAEPVLAQSITYSEDGLTATVTLRQGVRFHNGSALTARDVVYSYEQAKESAYYGPRFTRVTDFVSSGTYTVMITMDTTCESVGLLLDFPIIRSGTAGQAIPDGTGPFLPIHTGNTENTTLVAFEKWWGEERPLGYDELTLVACTTSTDIRDHFEYGDVNLVCTDPNAAAYAPYHSDSDYELWSANTTVMQYLGFNHNHEVYANKDICAAVTYLIDRDVIVAEDMGGFALPATLPASPMSPYYDAGLAADYAYDPETFHTKLEEAQVEDYTEDGILDVYYKGYPEPLAGRLIVSAANPQRVATANRIAATLNAYGFDITVTPLDPEEFRAAMSSGDYELYYAETRLSANFDLTPFFRAGGSLSYGGLESTTMENLCVGMLENSGNAYDLHKRIMDRGLFCPIAFKSYAIYTTRGTTGNLDPDIDWWLR